MTGGDERHGHDHQLSFDVFVDDGWCRLVVAAEDAESVELGSADGDVFDGHGHRVPADLVQVSVRCQQETVDVECNCS